MVAVWVLPSAAAAEDPLARVVVDRVVAVLQCLQWAAVVVLLAC